MTTWSALLGDAEPAEEQDAEPGFFGRLRDSLGKSRRALTDQIAAAAFDPGDDEAWERLEEALIAADVGVPATAELVGRLEARGEVGDLTEALVEEATAMLGEPGTLRRSRKAERHPRRRRQRDRQDDDDRKARVPPERARPLCARRGRRHLPRRGRGAARDLGRPRPGATSSARSAGETRPLSPTTRSKPPRRAAGTSSSSTPPAACTRRRT